MDHGYLIRYFDKVVFFASQLIFVIFWSSSTLPDSSSQHLEIVSAKFTEMGLRWQSFAEKADFLLFQSSEFGSLVFKNGKYSDNYKNRILVMVSASPLTTFGKMVLQHPGAIAVLRPKDSYYQKILLEVATYEESNALAIKAHRDNATCGSFEQLSLITPVTLKLADESAPIPSYWNTTVSLPAVKQSLSFIDPSQISSHIKSLEAVGSRYHAGANAAKAVATVKALWQEVLPANASVTETSNTPRTSQNNLVVSIPGETDDATTVIIGAHLDSINLLSPSTGTAPGADDDGSGIATLIELMRVIKSQGFKFHRRVEFHGYAAEEAGLIGSKVLSASYASAGRKVSGMLQMDMNAYANDGNQDTIYLVTNDTSARLRRQLADVIGLYGIAKISEMPLTAGSSDHKSWTNAGYESVFPFEHPGQFNRAIHTERDTSNLLNLSLADRHTKAALAWLAHNAGLVGQESDHAQGLLSLRTAGDQLKVGIVPGDQGGERLLVAAPQGTSAVVACLLDQAADNSCKGDPVALTYAQTKDNINFYHSPADQSYNNEEIYTVTSYAEDGAVLAQRQFNLRQK